MTLEAKNLEGPQLSEGRDSDCLETRVPGRLQLAEVARSSIDKCEAAQRANKEESLQQEKLSTYEQKRVQSGHPCNKDLMALKPSERACVPCWSSSF